MASIQFDPRDGKSLIPYGPAETALYKLVETFERNGMTSEQWTAVHELRDAILPYSPDDEEDFSNSWEYDYLSDKYEYKPEVDYSVTVVIKGTITVKARTKAQAEKLAEEEIDDHGVDVLDVFDTTYEDIFEK